MSHRFTRPFGLGTLTALAALASLGLVACGDDDPTEPDEVANVRIVNASPSTGAITANSDESIIATNVAFQTSTLSGGCGTVEHDDDADIEFFSAGTSNGLGEIEYNFEAQKSYTVVFYAPNNATVYPETYTLPSAGNNALRFINATGSTGDVYLTTTTAGISGAPTVAALASKQASGFNSGSAPGGTFVEYPQSNVRVRMFNVGQTTGTPLADFTIQAIATNHVATIVLTPPPVGGTSTAFMVGSCVP